MCSACTTQPGAQLTNDGDTSSEPPSVPVPPPVPVPVPVAVPVAVPVPLHRPTGLPLETQIIIHQSGDGQVHVEHRAPTVINRHIIQTMISPIDPSQSIMGPQLHHMVSLQLPPHLQQREAPHSTPVRTGLV